jgi:hypothetical protein
MRRSGFARADGMLEVICGPYLGMGVVAVGIGEVIPARTGPMPAFATPVCEYVLGARDDMNACLGMPMFKPSTCAHRFDILGDKVVQRWPMRRDPPEQRICSALRECHSNEAR